MPIHPGSRVGTYEVSGSLGAGGMGEVYRARDLRLNRDVALKVLPQDIRHDPDRLARFEREAQALAALNHPNIATVHGFEDSGGQAVLIMELVEGDTLADRLREGPLPLDEARTLALQIVEGLDAAHEQGVVHRDLKPANIKVRPDGTLKILDFGLAKIFAPPDAVQHANLANSPTLTSPMMTTAGVVLGTAAYMSPEQARGRPVDKRADIWAFGCVFYEMLTGRPAFAGETSTDILAAVVQQEPDWTRLPAAVPPSTVSLLRRCLQKNARERLRDIGDARVELREAAGSVATAPSVAAARRRPPFALVAGAFLAGVLIAGAAVYTWLSNPDSTAAPAPAARFSIVLPPGLKLELGRGSCVVVSPDGSRVVYVARAANGPTGLYLRDRARFESELLPGTEGAESPFFSPEGRWVAFFADGQLKKVSLDGGAPVTLGPIHAARGHAWLQDDGILVTHANNVGLSRIPAGGGSRQPFTSLAAGQMSHRWPRQLPDGSAVLFSVWNDVGFEGSRIAAQRAGSTEQLTVVETGGGYPRFLRDPASGLHYLLYARSEGILGARFDARALKVTGTSVPVLDGVLTNLSGGAHFDVGADGTLAYVPGTHGEEERELVWVTPGGQTTPALQRANIGRFFSLDQGGTRLLRVNAAERRRLSIENLERGTTMPLPTSEDAFVGAWSPDGRWVIYGAGAPVTSLYRVPADGSGKQQQLTSSQRSQQAEDVSPDGAWLAYYELNPESKADIWILRLPADGAEPAAQPDARPFVQTDSIESQPRFSPDMRWVAYQSNLSGRFEIYIRSFPEGERTLQVSTEGGIEPMWSTTSTELYYRGLKGALMAAALKPLLEGSVIRPRMLFDASRYENTFGVSQDGKRFLMMPLVSAEATATEIKVILNFAEELRQRVR